MKAYSILLALAALSVAGCQTQTEAIHHEGVYAGAGNAVAANTVMQMVDPWPAGVEDTHLATPADLEQHRQRVASEPQSAGVADGAEPNSGAAQ